MAEPATSTGHTGADNEALDILRRLEPMLTRLDARTEGLERSVQTLGHRIEGVEGDLLKLNDRLQGVEGDIKDINPRLSRLEGQVSQLPTLIQIVTAVLAVNAGIIAIGFGLARALTVGG